MIDVISVTQVAQEADYSLQVGDIGFDYSPIEILDGYHLNISRIWKNKNPGTRLKFKLYPDGNTLGSIYRVVSGYGYIDKINYANSVYHNDNIVRYEIKVQSYTTRFMKRKKKNAQASVSSKDC